MNKTTWIIFAAVCAIFLGVLVVVAQKDKVDVSGIDHAQLQAASEINGNIADHVLGAKDSKVTLIEYGDFQCPYCGTAHAKVKDITDTYGDKITFIFRNFPLPTMHPNAKAAAAAAEAAGLQGKYWEMHDKLYTSQRDWEGVSVNERTDKFVAYAQEIGVKDIEKFKTDMGSDGVNKKINFDLALGAKAEVTGTPTFFLNGERVTDEQSGSVINGDGSLMKKAIDEALK